MTLNIDRPTIEQNFIQRSISADTTAVSIYPSGSQGDYITAMIFSVPTGEAQSAFVGKQNVGIGSGLEIPVGVPIAIYGGQTRQLYELQKPLTSLDCDNEPFAVPIPVFDPSNWFVIAAAATVFNITLFPEAYV